MKICIFTNHFFPEDFKVNDIAFSLAKTGFDVTVVTAVPDYPKGKFFDGYGWFKKNREIVNGCRCIRLPVIPRGNGNGFRLALQYFSFWFSSSAFSFFHKFFCRYDAVFVHLTSPFFVALSALHLKKFQKIPMIFWLLDLWPESVTAAAGIKNPLILKPLERQVKKVFDGCEKILIGSRGFEKSILQKGDYKNKIEYFPNWCETISSSANFEKYKNVEPFCFLNENDFVILFAGNLGESQNLDFVLEAAEKLRQNENIKFIFLGDGRAKKNLVQKSSEKNLLEKNVFFPGKFPVESMPFFMSKASVLLVSLKDNFIFNSTVPAKVQFYMAQEKPILAALNGDGADLIREADCGFAVNSGDEKNLAETILKISGMQKTELEKLGANGKKFYEANFKKSDLMNQLEKIFRDEIEKSLDKENWRHTILTKRNETKRNETKRNETKRNETKRNETKRNETVIVNHAFFHDDEAA
jgi:glycosyltransferase involved in cell wall biosynthesis